MQTESIEMKSYITIFTKNYFHSDLYYVTNNDRLKSNPASLFIKVCNGCANIDTLEFWKSQCYWFLYKKIHINVHNIEMNLGDKCINFNRGLLGYYVLLIIFVIFVYC